MLKAESKKASVADLPEITKLGRNESKGSNSGWRSCLNSQDKRDVFSIAVSQISVLFVWVFQRAAEEW